MSRDEESGTVPARKRLDGPLGPAGSMGSTANGRSILPGRAYTDEGWWRAEQEAVFAGRWVWVAYEHQVAEVGDVHPCEVAGQPLLVVRDTEGIHVVHNVCRHRGLVLCDAPAKRARLRCPYHGWSYGLDGRLLATPFWDRSAGTPVEVGDGRVGRAEDRAVGAEAGLSLDLVPVASAVWAGMVFVHLGGGVPSFDEAVAPLARRWTSLDLTRLAHVATRRWEVEANWKLVVENFLDFYHLPFIHPEVGSAAAALDADDLVLGDGIIGGVYPRGATGKASKTGRPLPSFTPGLPTDLPPEVRDRQDLFCLFPNTLLFLESDWLQVITLEPQGPDRTVEHMAVFVDRDATGDEFADARASLCDVLFGVNDQDMPVLRRLQAAKRSPVADHLHLVDHWDQVTAAFQLLVHSAVTPTA